MENPLGGRIEENRYILTNLIQCHPDTVRVVPSDENVDIFALQEKVIASILQASVEQIAIAEAPKILDPIQQTVSTTIRGYIHNSLVSRKEVLTAIQRLGSPLPGVYLKTLRKAYDTFLLNKDIHELLAAVNAIGDTPASDTENGNGTTEQSPNKERKVLLKRDDLKLICFEYVWH